MNRPLLASALLTASLVFGPATPSHAQICPWGMAAQVHVQVQWQQQAMVQQHAAAHMQLQQIHHQVMHQQMAAHAMVMQHHQNLMHLNMHAQLHQAVQRQALANHLTMVQHQHLVARQTNTALQHHHLWFYGRHPGPALHLHWVTRHTTTTQRVQDLTRTNQLHRVTHLQHITTNRQMVPQRTYSTAHSAQQLRHVTYQRKMSDIVQQRPHYTYQRQSQVMTHRSPTVQIRASMSVSCGSCHAGHPNGPAVAQKPLVNPLRGLARKPDLPLVARPPQRPMHQPAAPPRQQLFVVTVVRPVIQPVVRVPFNPGPIVFRPSFGPVPLRPVVPAGVPMVARPPAPLGPIAMMQPPSLPPMVRRMPDLPPLPMTTGTPPSSPGSSTPSPLPPLDGTTADGTSSVTDSTGRDGAVMQLVESIARKSLAEKRRDDRDRSSVQPDLVRRTPPLPSVEGKYPAVPLLSASERFARPAPSGPSLVEVVLRAPQVPLPSEPVQAAAVE